MKKLISLVIISVFALTTTVAVEIAYAADTTDWYQYNGYSTSHSFSVKFPLDWQSKTYGDNMQGFAPEEAYGDSYFIIQEFEGKTFDQVLQYYVNENTELVESKDFIFSSGEDLVAKEAIYLDTSEGKEYPRTLIKRGSLIVVLSGKNLENVKDFPVPDTYCDIVDAIYSSFTFTDEWHQYMDLEESYTFIFPTALEMESFSDGVTVFNTSNPEEIIFSIFKYENTSLQDAPKEAEGYNEDLEETEETFFHGIKNTLTALYRNSEYKKDFSRIFVEKDGTSYALSDVNIETNFPRMDYYNQYIVEMLESFEFFDIDIIEKAFMHFPDVGEEHVNKTAINALTERGIIAGYPDGTFQPDGEINRAELTKMIVATRIEPDTEEYKNCFPDVKNDWYAPYVCYAKEQGWVEGYESGLFKPNQEINRMEALKIILEVLFEEMEDGEMPEEDTPSDIDITAWYGKYFIFADNRNLLDKQHVLEENEQYYYYPGENISRKEVAETIYRSIKNLSLPFL